MLLFNVMSLFDGFRQRAVHKLFNLVDVVRCVGEEVEAGVCYLVDNALPFGTWNDAVAPAVDVVNQRVKVVAPFA